MTDLPDPLVPSDVDLRGMPYMPLDVVRLFDSDFYALSNGAEFKAGLSLWCKAFLQVPAGSLPNDERLLAHLSGAGAAWPKVRDMALHGWVKCNDGRLYHRTVAEKALDAWKARTDRRARTEAARKARQSSRADSDTNPPPPATTSVTENATDDVTNVVTLAVTGSKGTEGKGREGKIRKEEEDSVLRTGADAPLADARSQLWSEGLATYRRLTGKGDGPSRSALGRLCKSTRDDCATVLAALREADDLRPLDPMAWLTRRCSLANPEFRNGFLGLIASEGMEMPARPASNPVTAFLEASDVTTH